MPDWLWWLSPVLVAPLAAVAWTAWTGRSRGPEQPEDTMRAYERFRDALGTPLPHHAPPRTGRAGDPAGPVLPQQGGPKGAPEPGHRGTSRAAQP